MFNHHRFGWIERDKINQRFEPAHVPFFTDGAVHREDGPHGQKQRQQYAIKKRDVIRCDKNTLAIECLRIASHADAKQDTKQCAEEPKKHFNSLCQPV
ncbi:Uncharacterised protein [Enterobacter cloacae]|nr:Uncharacterised protein [Enterobacter cloacae]